MHYKIDLLTDEQMAHFDTKVGDVLHLFVPDAQGERDCTVTNIDVIDAGKHPESGEHLTRVTLELEP